MSEDTNNRNEEAPKSLAEDREEIKKKDRIINIPLNVGLIALIITELVNEYWHEIPRPVHLIIIIISLALMIIGILFEVAFYIELRTEKKERRERLRNREDRKEKKDNQ